MEEFAVLNRNLLIQQQGKQRSRSRSGSSAITPSSSVTAILSHPTTTSLSTSQPSIGSSRSNRGKAINAGLSSSSSPARLLNSNVQQETSALARSSRGSGRIRSSSDLQPIMPLPTAVPSPSTLVPRPILPQTDSSTLLAQLLTSSNQPSSTTLVLTSDPSTSRYVNHSIDLLNGTHSASFSSLYPGYRSYFLFRQPTTRPLSWINRSS